MMRKGGCGFGGVGGVFFGKEREGAMFTLEVEKLEGFRGLKKGGTMPSTWMMLWWV